MELKKQDVGVWVKASEELPPIDLHTVTINPVTEEFSWFCFQNGDTFDADEEWLKPLKDVFLLTKDELLRLIKDAMLWIDDTVGSINDNAERFLESIKQ